MPIAFIARASAVFLASSRSPFYRDGLRSVFPSSLITKMPRSYRAWSYRQLHHTNEKLREPCITVGRLSAFEDAGVDVSGKFVRGEDVLDEVKWIRDKDLDSLAQELVELYTDLQAALDAKRDWDRVEHLGHGVYAQQNKLSIDRDGSEGSPVTITREESRSVVHHALDALQSRYAVCVTGQPGIGKTRGSMMYAIQTLLHRQAAVLYVGYKSRKMLLFLPTAGGKYRVWRGNAEKFGESRFIQEPRVVAVIDPPEEGPYTSMGECRVLKFVSNNAERHFRNWEKDGVLLVTSMPTERKIIVMTQILWDEDKSPHPWQRGKLCTLEQKMTEIGKRAELVGPIPRLVFDSDSFGKAIIECLSGAFQAANVVSDSELYEALHGRYSPYLAKHPASASCRLFFLNPNLYHHKTWRDRKRHQSKLQLTPIAAHILRGRLLEKIELSRNISFEDLAYNILCKRLGLLPDTDRIGERTFEEGFRRLVLLHPDTSVFFRPGVGNFPLIDFASGTTVWYNANSADPRKAAVIIEHKGALRFLREMEKYMLEVYSRDAIREILECDPPRLIIVSNCDMRTMLDREVGLSLFDVPVRIEMMNVKEVPAKELLDGMDRTKKLLQEWHQQQALWEIV